MAKTIVVTGASSGIGAALARQLAQRGDQVVLAARNKGALQTLAQELGAHSLAVPTDVTVRSEVERLRDRAIGTFGSIDVWINNAGRGMSKLVADLTDDDIDDMITVNLKSALYGMQAVLPHFKTAVRGRSSTSRRSLVACRWPRSVRRIARRRRR